MVPKLHLSLAIVSGLALAAGILVFLNPSHNAAAASVLYVAPAGNCGDASPCYSSIQSALDAAMPEDVIKVATGVYSGVRTYTETYTLVTQHLYINKSITLAGGYTITNWSSPDPAAYPVILDAQELGRVIYITGTIDVDMDGFRLINGNGGIYISASSHAEIGNCSIQNSTGWFGGYAGYGILNYGTLLLTNSSLVSSTVQDALSSGGGISNFGKTDIYSATIRDNLTLGCTGIANDGRMNVFTTVIQNNRALEGMGGGICNTGSFYLASSSVLNNDALVGGGISNDGSMNILNTTISGNNGPSHGSGIANWGWSTHVISTTGRITITNSTIVSNTSTSSGGIYNHDLFGMGVTPTLSIKNTIVAFNTGANCSDMITSLGHNIEDGRSCGFNKVGDLSSTDPGLGPLGYYGGPTLTYSLVPGSPAIDAADNIDCPPIDQRGVHRPQGASCDIGAFELPKLFLPLLWFLP